MAKKGQAVQLQQELTNDIEWESFLDKSGLLLIDIFSDWSGPCVSMIATLKKIKLELGGDNLQLAVARSDTIEALTRFRNASEPTWMFVINRKMVNLLFGANAPKLNLVIANELKRYQTFKDGGPLVGREISDLSEEENKRYQEKKAIEDEAARIEKEKAERALREWRLAVANHVLEHYPSNGVIIIFPMIKDLVKPTLADLWETSGLSLQTIEKVTFTEAILEELLYFCKYQFNADDLEDLLSAETIVYLVKPSHPDQMTGILEDIVLKFVYGDSKCPPGSRDSPADKLTSHLEIKKEEPVAPPPVEIEELEMEDDDLAQEASATKIETPPAEEVAEAAEEAEKAQEGSEEGSDEGEESEMGGSEEGSKAPSEVHIPSKEEIIQSPEVSKARVPSLPPENLYENTYPVTGLWTPSDRLTTATAIKLFFRKLYDPIALPEPVPTPPHIAIAYEPFKRYQIADLMREYKDDVIRYGFFTSEDPTTATLVAKNMREFEKRAAQQVQGERLVVQLSRKRSEPWCMFAQYGPTTMSFNTVEGEKQCKKFFPPGYDEPEEPEEVVVEEKKPKKGKKAASKEAVIVEEKKVQPEGDVAEGEEPKAEGEVAVEGQEPSTVDKATDAPPSEEPPAEAPVAEAPADEALAEEVPADEAAAPAE